MYFRTDTEAIIYRNEIMKGLIELRKAGVIWGIWCDADILHIKATGHFDPLVRITWEEAEVLIGASKKPPQRSVMITLERKLRA